MTWNGLRIVPSNYAWTYDGLDNRLSERLSTTGTNAVGKSTYNNLNQLLSTAGGGRVQITGSIDEPGTVTVNGASVPVKPDKTFVAEVDTTTGSNTFEVKATDQKGNIRTNQFRLDTTANGGSRTLTYDLNGNCTQDGTTTYGWDAQNRLVWVLQGTRRSEFTYDGTGRRVRIIEKDGATVLSDHRFVWLGAAIAERRDTGSNAVQIRFTGNGEVEGTTKRYYARDHLGSVREVVDQAGGVLVRYDYSPFGQRTRVGGSAATYVCTFGYTGHVHHEATGMALTWYRAYDPANGRWLSRDPIKEKGGVNLYGYVENNPINATDPLGLCLVKVGYSPVALGYVHMYVLVGDDEGSLMQYRGGPSDRGGGGGSCGDLTNAGSNRNSGYGVINVISQVWNSNAIEWPRGLPGEGLQVAYNVPGPCPDDWTGKIAGVFKHYRQNQIPYRPLGPNSNTFASDVLRAIDVKRPQLPRRAPGSGERMKQCP